MKILITGATGFVGRHLCKKLISKSIDIRCIIRSGSDTDFLKSNNIQYFIFNGKIDSLIDYMQNEKFDGVAHLASLFVAEHKIDDIENLISSNVIFGTKLLETSVSCGVKWFLNTGTFWQHYNGEVYNPVNFYAATKQAFEDMARYYVEMSHIKFVTLKLNDTYGPDDTRKKIFTLWEEIAESGDYLNMSPGEQLIDMVHIDDVVSAYYKLIETLGASENSIKNLQSFYVTSGRKITLKELAKEYESKNNVKLNINWGRRPYRKREVMEPRCTGENIKDANLC